MHRQMVLLREPLVEISLQTRVVAVLILAYQQSRGAQFTDQDLTGLDQNVDVDSPWAQLFSADAQRQEVLTDLDADNDAPPYPADYAGGIEHPEGTLIGSKWIEGTSVGSQTSYGSFEAPMGLIKLDFNVSAISGDMAPCWITFDTEIIGAC